MSEKIKFVEIKDRKFRITKFKALQCSTILLKVSGVLSPIAEELKNVDFKKIGENPDLAKIEQMNLKNMLNDFNVAGILAALGKIPEQDFEYLQEKCLKVCYEDLDSGSVRVLNDDGSLGVIGLDDDPATMLALTAHALIFNMKGFFSGSPLASMLTGLLTTSPQGSST